MTPLGGGVGSPAWAGSLAERGGSALLNTYARYPLELVEGSGCRLVDSRGRGYLDFAAGIAVSVLGHSHPAVVAALEEAASGLLHVSNLYWTEPMIRLAERLNAAAGTDRALFCNSGTEAIEAGIKLARRARPERRRTVCFERSFHGRTLGSLSVTAQPKYQEPFQPLLSDVEVLPFGDFDAAAEVINGATCLVIAEPIQGEGGMRPAPAGWLAHLRHLCDEAGAVLLLDEVQAGVGRTGTFLAHQHEGITPDIIACAKALAGGLPMGALLARNPVASAFLPGDHGCTFGGGPLVAEVADTVIAKVLEDGFLDAVTAKGRRLLAGLEAIVERRRLAVAARGRGLMLGLVLGSPVASEVVQAAQDAGLLLCPAGPDVVRLVPPLVVDDREITEALEILDAAVDATGEGGTDA